MRPELSAAQSSSAEYDKPAAVWPGLLGVRVKLELWVDQTAGTTIGDVPPFLRTSERLASVVSSG
jgi:hypothetical protein